MSSVRKRILKSGETRWLTDYRDQDGTRRARQFRSKREAVDFGNRTGVEIQEGVHTPDSTSVTIAEAGELWLTWVANEQREVGTLKQYRQHLTHVTALIGQTKLSKLSPAAVAAFRDALLRNHSRKMAAKILVSFKAILKEANRRGLINRNPAATAKIEIAARHEDGVNVPAKAEVCAMLSKSAELWPSTKPWRALIVVAALTGLRLSELRGLTWPNVDVVAGTLKVVQRADFECSLGSPKSKAGKRTVPLSPMVRNTLREWKLASTEDDLVFPGANGKILRTSGVHRMCWRPLLRALGLVDLGEDGKEAPRYTFHSLRHCAASLMIESGMQPKKLQTVMGHSSIKITFDVYGHLFDSAEDDANAMAAAERRLFS